jgi:hypothetical protein
MDTYDVIDLLCLVRIPYGILKSRPVFWTLNQIPLVLLTDEFQTNPRGFATVTIPQLLLDTQSRATWTWDIMKLAGTIPSNLSTRQKLSRRLDNKSLAYKLYTSNLFLHFVTNVSYVEGNSFSIHESNDQMDSIWGKMIIGFVLSIKPKSEWYCFICLIADIITTTYSIAMDIVSFCHKMKSRFILSTKSI